MPGLIPRKKKLGRPLLGVSRDDSDDELGTDDYPWEWIYDSDPSIDEASPAPRHDDGSSSISRKRKRPQQRRIVGARMGSFECRLGDCVLLKAEGFHEAWVGIVHEFVDDDEGEKAAMFMWFNTEKEIHNKDKKRSDFLWNELYLSSDMDTNSLTTINGKAYVMSPDKFLKKYPNGKVPRNSPQFGKMFVCRRGCNTRTATYTEEFIWEDLYNGNTAELAEFVRKRTKATRRRRTAREPSAEGDYTGQAEDQDVDDWKSLQRTPKKPRTQEVGTPKRQKSAGKSVTPSHRKIMIKKHLEFTPLATRVLSPSHHHSSPFQIARSNLHVASVPTSLPCREAEFSLVYSHLEAAITEGTGSCIYISGTPGTGKTATVREVVSRLDEAVRSDELDDFIFVEINGMKITDPHQAYSLLWEALKGQRVSPSQALDLLEREFSHPGPRRVPCVVLMDELDQLVTKNQGVMYNFFNWPGLRHSRLIVLAVANTMDLPERTLSNKISSRLGLTRITFPGYNHEQLMKIVQSRLEGVSGNIVDPDAIQFASRKVAAVSGDARRALDICRRAVELAEADSVATNSNPPTPSKKAKANGAPDGGKKRAGAQGRVTIETVRRAINEATSNPLQQYLRTLPFACRLFLSALLARTRRTGLAESTFGDVLEEMHRTLKIAASSHPLEVLDRRRDLTSGFGKSKADSRALRPSGMSQAAVDLMGAGIIHLEGQRPDRPSKIRLAIGDEDAKLAFGDDPEVRELGLIL